MLRVSDVAAVLACLPLGILAQVTAGEGSQGTVLFGVQKTDLRTDRSLFKEENPISISFP